MLITLSGSLNTLKQRFPPARMFPLAIMHMGSIQKDLSYLTLIVRNSLLTELKLPNALNNFNDKLKGHFFKKLGRRYLCLWIYFGENKTKSILFSQARGLMEIDIPFAGHSIKQHETIAYFRCQLDAKLSGKAMASKVLKKINAKLKFLYRQSRDPTPVYKRLLCNAA